MEQTVKVLRRLPDGMAEVIRIRESACSGDCHKCAGCGAAQQKMLLTVKNPIDAQAGDVVVISSDSSAVLKAAAVLYLLPLVLFLAGYLLGENLWQRGGLVGLCALALGVAVIKIYDHRLSRASIEYTITAFVGK